MTEPGRCPRCGEADCARHADTIATHELRVPGPLAAALDPTTAHTQVDLDDSVRVRSSLAADPWREVESISELPVGRIEDLRIALALLERGLRAEVLNRYLVLSDFATGLDFPTLLAGNAECEPAWIDEARREARSSGGDFVARFRDLGFRVFESRSRLLLGALDLPASIGPYRIVARLGRGGMGEVFLGYRPGLEKDFAIKRLLALPGSAASLLARFEQEAQALARLRHAHIVSLVDVDLAPDAAYIAMDHVAGVDLEQRIRGGLPRQEAIRILEKIARALDHAHRAGILHRDVKPLNVLVDAEGEPYLLDFGLARIAAGRMRMTGTQQILGTPSYMPPETLTRSDAYSVQGDVYSLGVALFQCLTGRLPHPGKNVAEILHKVKSGQVVPPRSLDPSIPEPLERICLECLSLDPADRPATAREVAQSLADWLRRDGARREALAERPRALAIGGGLSALAIAGVVAAILLAGGGSDPDEDDPTGPPAVPEAPVTAWTPLEVWGESPGGRWGSGSDPSGDRVAFAGGYAISPTGVHHVDSAAWILDPPREAGEAYHWRRIPLPGGAPRAKPGLAPGPGDDEFALVAGVDENDRPLGDLWFHRAGSGWYAVEAGVPALSTQGLAAVLDRSGDRLVVFRLAGGAMHVAEAVRRGSWTWTDLPGDAGQGFSDTFAAAHDPSRRRVYFAHPRTPGNLELVFRCYDLAGSGPSPWSVLETRPRIDFAHRSNLVCRDGVLVLALLRSRESGLEFHAGRVGDGHVELRPLPPLPEVRYGLVWHDAATDRLLVTGSTGEWQEPWRVWSFPMAEARRITGDAP